MVDEMRYCPRCRRLVPFKKVKGIAYCIYCNAKVVLYENISYPPDSVSPPQHDSVSPKEGDS